MGNPCVLMNQPAEYLLLLVYNYLTLDFLYHLVVGWPLEATGL